MSFGFDEAKLIMGELREGMDGEPVEVTGGERRGMAPDDERYQLELLTPGYEIPSGALTALHRVGPFTLRHLGAVRDDDDRHVWVIKPE